MTPKGSNFIILTLLEASGCGASDIKKSITKGYNFIFMNKFIKIKQ